MNALKKTRYIEKTVIRYKKMFIAEKGKEEREKKDKEGLE